MAGPRTGPNSPSPTPLIETVTTDLVHAHRLGPPADDTDRLRSFATRNTVEIHDGIHRAATRLLALAANVPDTSATSPAVTPMMSLPKWMGRPGWRFVDDAAPPDRVADSHRVDLRENELWFMMLMNHSSSYLGSAT